MPQVKKVKPLFKMCLQFITFDMKYWWRWCNQLEKNNLVDNSAGTAVAIEQKERALSQEGPGGVIRTRFSDNLLRSWGNFDLDLVCGGWA